MSERFRRIAFVLLVLFSSSCASQEPKGSVTVLAPWIDTGPSSEGHAFQQLLAAFTDRTGIHVNYQGTRALSQVLLSSVPGGSAPDIAVLSSPGDLARYARNGKLHPLDDVLDDGQQAAYNPTWLLSHGGVEHIYTVPIKANLKSLIWYNRTGMLESVPETWEELVAYSRSLAGSGTTPWCMGMADAPNSGWPGVDMINDIFLHRFGPEVYQQWAAGRLPWTSDQVREAWISWGEFSSDPKFVHGGPRAVLLTDFQDAGRSMFADPPRCKLEHQASFMMGFYLRYQGLPRSALKSGVDFDYFGFPTSGNQGTRRLWDVSIDLAGMFNDTSQARDFMRFLSTEEAQRIWPSIAGSSAFTVNKNVDSNVHGEDQISKRIADVFKSSDTLCFGAASVMPATMRNAYNRAVLEYLSDPRQLEALLRKLEQVRNGIASENWLNLPCAQ